MREKFKKLMILIDNYDKIMEMLENNKEANEPKKETKKYYSLLNTPHDQVEFINKKLKGEK